MNNLGLNIFPIDGYFFVLLKPENSFALNNFNMPFYAAIFVAIFSN